MEVKCVKLGELIDRFGGHLIGSPDIEVVGIAPLVDAKADQVSFLSNAKFRSEANSSVAAALILSEVDDQAIGQTYTGARIITPHPYVYFAHAAQYFFDLNAPKEEFGIHPTAFVHANASVSPRASIGPHAVIEAGAVIEEGVVVRAGVVIGRGVVIGAGSLLHSHVTVYDYCEIGKRCILHAGAVIGADGFGFANEQGKWIKIPQTGRVLIGDDVEIGANTCIDRGALADTIIEEGVKLDNQIQIGHNCHIGAHTAMAGCVGVAGSAKIGKYCTFGGAAMIAGHLTIVDHVHISPGTLIPRSILEPGQYSGFYPMAKHAEWEKSAVILRNLSSLRDKLRHLEKSIKSFSEKPL